MSTVDVVFTRTFDGDYMADFSCNDSDLPHDTAVFCRTMIDDTELSALRAQAAEAETLRAERDELKAKANVSICAWCGQECEKESGAIAEHVIVCEKRPEHAMLAKFEELLHTVSEQDVHIAELEQDLRYMNSEHRLKDYAQLEDTIVEQATALEEAYRMIDFVRSLVVWDEMDVWLAANAPAQTKPE